MPSSAGWRGSRSVLYGTAPSSSVELTADGPSVWIEPVIPSAAPIVLGDDLKDLPAAAARRVVEALGGSLELEGERLQVRLPT